MKFLLKRLSRNVQLQWIQIRRESAGGGGEGCSWGGECRVLKASDCDQERCALDPCHPHPKVVIIGAGLAGLSAAHRLMQCHLKDFTILEAKSRPGGRIHSIWLGQEVVELGAQWIQGGSFANPIYSLAAMEGLIDKYTTKEVDKQKGMVYLTSDGRAIDTRTARMGIKMYRDIRRRMFAQFSLKEKSNKTVKSFAGLTLLRELNALPEEFRYDVARVVHGLFNGMRARWGVNLGEIGADGVGQTVEIPGSAVAICSGLSGILAPLLRNIPKENIKYDSPVERIDWGDQCQPVMVRTCEGVCYPADYCIIAVSLGVLKKFHNDWFCPELPPEKVQAIEKLGFGLVDKIFLEYKQPFWAQGEGTMRLAWLEEELEGKEDINWVTGVAAVEEVMSSPRYLMISVAGEGARTMEKLSDEQVAKDLTKMLRNFTGDPTIPMPVSITRSSWGSDIRFLGSGWYPSWEAEGEHSVEEMCMLGRPVPGAMEEELPPRLLWAGEATVPGRAGTLHGARESGLREADRVLALAKAYSGPPPRPLICLPCFNEPQVCNEPCGPCPETEGPTPYDPPCPPKKPPPRFPYPLPC